MTYKVPETVNIMRQKKLFASAQLTLGSFNIQGGFNSKNRFPDFNTLLSDFDICCLQETWLEYEDIVDIPGFECFRSERKKGKKAYKNSGGVLM